MREKIEKGLLLMGLPVWLFALHHGVAGDGELRFMDLLHVLRGEPTEHPYSLIGPLVSAPLVLLGLLQDPEAARNAASIFNLLLVSLVAWRLCGWDDGGVRTYRRSQGHRIVFLLLSLSMLPKHLQGYYGEVFSAVLAYAGIVLVYERGAVLGWALLALAGANTPALLVPVTLLATVEYVWRLSPRASRWAPLAGATAGWLLWAGENALRWGSVASAYTISYAGLPEAAPFRTALIESTQAVWFGFPPAIGLWAILFSPGKGILWYAPALWLAILRTWTPLPLLSHHGSWERVRTALLVFLGGMVLVYSSWAVWHGDWYWGPRYFLFAAFVASWLLARELLAESWDMVPLSNRLLVTVILVASAYVGFCGAVLGQQEMGLCQERSMGFLCWYVPDWSGLYRPLVRGTRPLDLGDWTVLAYLSAVLLAAVDRVWRPWLSRVWHPWVTVWRTRRGTHA